MVKYVVHITICLSICNLCAERLQGTIGLSAQWGSGWLQFNAPENFKKGEIVKLKIGGHARKILVRFLQDGEDPNSSSGLIGDAFDVPDNRIIQIPLKSDYSNIIQISVHGNSNPFNIPLGEGNGSATLQYAEKNSDKISMVVQADKSNCLSLKGEIGHSAQWGSGWIQFNSPMSFKAGETIQLKIGGSAKKILFRLLEEGNDPGSSTGIIGDAKDVPSNRIISITLTEDYSNIIQLSVHGGEKPWGIWDLGERNGPATIEYVKHCVQ